MIEAIRSYVRRHPTLQKWIRAILNPIKVPYGVILASPFKPLHVRNADIDEYIVKKVLKRPIVFTDRFGIQYLLTPDDNIALAVSSSGWYEVSEQEFCAAYVKPGMTIFDVGANKGMYTMLFARLVHEGQVHAFEPEDENLRFLKVNQVLNGFTNITINKAVVYSQPGNIELNVYPKTYSGWHTIGNPKLVSEGQLVTPMKKINVPAVTLDAYCNENQIPTIDFLKLDVEGAEADVLLGAEKLLQSHRIGCILFEISVKMVIGMQRQVGDTFNVLLTNRYDIYRLDEKGNLGSSITTPDPTNFANYIALPRT